MSNFSEIKNRNDFFKLLNISSSKMNYLLYNKKEKGPENCYHTFQIKKRTGGVRIINSPNDELKYIQKKLYHLLYNNQKNFQTPNNISHAFQKGKSIITNAKIHRNKKYVLNVDLQDFFPSFHFGRVKGFFEKNKNFKVPKDVALTIAQLTCYKGILPQGSPSSPIITNLICTILDFRLLKLAKKYKLDYSRYADDLTFSTNFNFKIKIRPFLQDLTKEINRAGFKLNDKKTRLQFNTSRQEVTGLIVNKKLNVPKEYYKNTRAMAYNFYKNGFFYINGKQGELNQLEGRFAFINQLDSFNNKYFKEQSSKKALNNHEKEYQKFLFYKYFYGNKIPTIVTEGETDINYLKAALKNLHKDYPNLIEKKNNDFIFKIFFLKRSKKFKYFFNLQETGADSMYNLYLFFNNKNPQQNFINYFNKLSSKKPSSPNFFIFDNELTNSKPLKKFIDKLEDHQTKLKNMKKDLSLKLAENLYLVTFQLLGESPETEIEDLFDQETLNTEIGGKKFSKDGDCNKYYGKKIFSKYILKNYDKINFENFREILNNINKLLSS